MAKSAGKRAKFENCESSDESDIGELALSIKNINVLLSGINKKLEDLPKISTEIQQINNAIANLHSDFNKHESAIKENQRNINVAKEDLQAVQKTVASLEDKVEYYERQKRNLNIIISNIPAVSDQKFDVNVVKEVCKKFDVDSTNHIYNIRRLRNKNNTNISPKLMFTCSNIDIKNKIMSKYIEMRTAKTNLTLLQLGLSEINEEVYISEHLTQFNNDIFYAARRAHKLDPEFFLSVFSRNGRICIKTKGNTRYTHINTRDDLYKLCSDDTRTKLLSLSSHVLQDNNSIAANPNEQK